MHAVAARSALDRRYRAPNLRPCLQGSQLDVDSGEMVDSRYTIGVGWR